MAWNKVSKKYILKTPWLSLRKDGYKNPQGAVEDYYIVERSDFVVIVPQTIDKKFILVRQYRPGVESVILNFPMGFIDKNEKPKCAADRELTEETGTIARKIKLIGDFLLAPGFSDTKGYVFFAENILIKKTLKAADCNEQIKSVELFTGDRIEYLIKKRKFVDLPSIAAYLLTKNCLK